MFAGPKYGGEKMFTIFKTIAVEWPTESNIQYIHVWWHQWGSAELLTQCLININFAWDEKKN